jgi:ABC-type phosphate transport system permease subunit
MIRTAVLVYAWVATIIFGMLGLALFVSSAFGYPYVAGGRGV